MPQLIILALFAIIILMYVVMSLFIIYHLAKYSISVHTKILSLIIFVPVASVMLIYNIILFFSVNWNGVIRALAP